jgi:bifunctional polynucleotide phosphatase/kinase
MVSSLHYVCLLEKKVEEKEYANSSQEMVLLVGQPCAGKTTFAKRQFVSKGYVHVNRDTLGTMTKCLKVTEEAIKEGKSVVVDSTNPTVAARFHCLLSQKRTKIL